MFITHYFQIPNHHLVMSSLPQENQGPPIVMVTAKALSLQWLKEGIAKLSPSPGDVTFTKKYHLRLHATLVTIIALQAHKHTLRQQCSNHTPGTMSTDRHTRICASSQPFPVTYSRTKQGRTTLDTLTSPICPTKHIHKLKLLSRIL